MYQCVCFCMYLCMNVYGCMCACKNACIYEWWHKRVSISSLSKKKFTGPTNGPSTLPAPSHHPTHKTPNFYAPDLEYWLQLYPPSDWTPIFSELSILHCQTYRYPNPFRMIIGPSLIHPKTVPSHKHPRSLKAGTTHHVKPCNIASLSSSFFLVDIC